MTLRVMTLGSRFLLSLLLARVLATAELGQYGLLTAMLAFGLLIVGLEFYSFTMRQIVTAEAGARVQIIANQLFFAVLILCIVLCGTFIAVKLKLLPFRFAFWFLLILTTEHLSLEATRILVTISRPVRAYIGLFIRGGVWVFVIALLMFLVPTTRTLETVLRWWVFGGIASIVFAGVSLRHLPWGELRNYRPDWGWILSGLNVARPFIVTAFGALILSYFDRFVIEHYSGSESLGIYTFYSTISIGVLSLGTSISHQFLPKVIEAFAAGSTSYIRILRTYCWSIGVAGSIAVVIAGLTLWPIVVLLRLDSYAAEIAIFYVMLVGVLIRIFADVPSYILYAAHSDFALLVCNLSAAAVSVLLNMLLVPSLGLIGAAYASVAGSVILFVALGAVVWRRILSEFGRSIEPSDVK